MASVILSRQEKGKIIADKPNQIIRQGERFYRVSSQSGHGMYNVVKARMNRVIGWVCDCADFTYRQVKCKHVWAVEFSLNLRQIVEKNVIEPIAINKCVYCKSEQIVKDGLRHNSYGNIQKWSCKGCGRYFTVNIGFEKMRATPQAVTSAMQLYFSGESLRNTQKFLRLQGVQVSHVAVLKWIRKYVVLMQDYLEQMTPQVSNTWRADELFLKVRGSMKYLYALMDDQTRFWIAQQVADTKYTADIAPLFREGKEVAGRVPSTVITDGAFNFESAFRTAYRRESNALMTQHIRHVRMSGDNNNNKMERLNGEIRDREKVMRNLKRPDTPILTGYQIYHNYIRPHMALEGKTPAEAAGIEMKGENKWLTIIQNAATRRKLTPQTA